MVCEGLIEIDETAYDPVDSIRISDRIGGGSVRVRLRGIVPVGRLFFKRIIVRNNADQIRFSGVVASADWDRPPSGSPVTNVHAESWAFVLGFRYLEGEFSGDAATVLAMILDRAMWTRGGTVAETLADKRVEVVFRDLTVAGGLDLLAKQVGGLLHVDRQTGAVLILDPNHAADGGWIELPSVNTGANCVESPAAGVPRVSVDWSSVVNRVSVHGRNALPETARRYFLHVRKFDLPTLSENRFFRLGEATTALIRLTASERPAPPAGHWLSIVVTPTLRAPLVGSVSPARFNVKHAGSSTGEEIMLAVVGLSVEGLPPELASTTPAFSVDSGPLAVGETRTLDFAPAVSWQETFGYEGYFRVLAWTAGARKAVKILEVLDNNLVGVQIGIGSAVALFGTDIAIGPDATTTESNIADWASLIPSATLCTAVIDGHVRLTATRFGRDFGVSTTAPDKINFLTVTSNAGRSDTQAFQVDLLVTDNSVLADTTFTAVREWKLVPGAAGDNEISIGADADLTAAAIGAALDAVNEVSVDVVGNRVRITFHGSNETAGTVSPGLSIQVVADRFSEINPIPCALVTEIYHQFVSTSGSQDLVIDGFTYYENIPTQAVFEFFRTCDGGAPVSLGEYTFQVDFAQLGCYWPAEPDCSEGGLPPCDGKAWRIGNPADPILLGPFEGCCGEEITVEFGYDHFICP